MPQTYYCLLTKVGEAKDANAKALGTALKITEMAVGDGNGALPVPDPTRTSLVHQVRRAPLNSLTRDPVNQNQVIAEQVLPENVGGWWIRELGLYDQDGDLVAIGNCAESYKPQLAQGSGRTQVVRMVLIMSSAATVELKVDPSIVLATRQYVDSQDAAHAAAPDPHPQYLTAAEGQAQIAAAVAALVNASPVTLDTLSELAAALGNDANFAATMTALLAQKAPLASPALTGTPTAPTPAQFDATTRIATMEALKRQGMQASSVITLSANAVLGADAAGATVINIANVPTTWTLPDVTTFPAGVRIELANFSATDAGVVTVVKSATGNNNYPMLPGVAGFGNPITLLRGNIIVLEANGGSTWLVVGGNAAIVTPPQFNKSLQVVNAEFVQRALGNFAGRINANNTQTLPASAAGNIINLGGAGTYTVTLPLTGAVAAGAALFFEGGSSNVTIATQAGDAIATGPSSPTSITLNAGETLLLESNALGQWRVISGSAHMKFSSFFGSLLSAANGYKKIPDPNSPTGYMIVQWASGSSQAAAGNQVINLPVQFPNANLFTLPGNLYASGAQNGGYGFISSTTSQVTVARNNVDNGNGVTPLIVSFGY